MEKDKEIFDISPKNMTAPLIIAQAICIAVLLIGVLIIKFGFADSFKRVQDFCKSNILEPTHFSDVFDGEKL